MADVVILKLRIIAICTFLTTINKKKVTMLNELYWVKCFDSAKKEEVAIDCTNLKVAIAVAFINICTGNSEVRVVNHKGELECDEEAICKKIDINDPLVIDIFRSIECQVSLH